MNRTPQSLISFVGVLFATASLAASSDRWGMYQGGPEHSGFVPQRVLANLAASAWAVQAQPHGTSGIAISDGVVVTTPYTYFQDQAPLVAQNVGTGHVEWLTNFGALYSVNQPAIDQGVIFVQTSNNAGATYLHAYRVDYSLRMGENLRNCVVSSEEDAIHE